MIFNPELFYKLPNFPPGDQPDIFFFENLPAILTGKEVKVLLPPVCTIIGVIEGYRLHFLIVVGRVN